MAAATHQSVTLHFPLAHMPVIITRLTTYLLERHWSFVQTRYHAERADFDVFDSQHQPLIGVRLQVADRPDPASETLAILAPRPLNTEATRLLQHLLQAELSP